MKYLSLYFFAIRFQTTASVKNISPGTNLNYYIEKDAAGKDSKLYLFAARCDSGFAICEFPIKVALDD